MARETVAELKLRLDGYESKTAEIVSQLNTQNERINQLSKDIITNKLNIETLAKEYSNAVSNIRLTLEDNCIDKSVLYISVFVSAMLFFAFGVIVGDYISPYSKANTAETTTETTTVVKPNKTTDLKKIVDKMTTGDRKKLSDCIEKAIQSDATEAYKLRENLHDNIIESFRDPEEKIWQPFRQYIVTKNPVDSYESAKDIYETIKTALQREVKESW